MLSTLADTKPQSPTTNFSPSAINVVAPATVATIAAEAMPSCNPSPPLPPTDLERSGVFPSEELKTPDQKLVSVPDQPRGAQPPLVRQNQVGNVLLHGEYIVSLVIDNKERLCLAQISNTLLKDFSYNEIHNRRVALGITCVQCTPVQLEILRRAGAMPISSRRCGMITKREAERLVKSFLEETTPPKLPDSFAFNVVHACGWGCKGHFIPSRYNSSRAKCIKCSFCQMFFSPNKFIFHFHRTSDSKYHHPDAANFNSWRRHLRLDYENPSEDLIRVWEDVKAMFNGGSRKRLMNQATGKSSHSGSSESSKRSRMDPHDNQPMPKMTGLPYPYPGLPMPPNAPCSNMAPAGVFLPRAPHPAFPFPAPDPTVFPPVDHTKASQPNIAEFWKTKSHSPYVHPFNYFWAKNLALYNDNSVPYRNVIDYSRHSKNYAEQTHMDKLEGRSPHRDEPHKDDVDKYFSAFKPVSRDTPKLMSPYEEKDTVQEGQVWLNRAHSVASDVSATADEEDSLGEPDEADINVTDLEQNDSNEPSIPDQLANDLSKANMVRQEADESQKKQPQPHHQPTFNLNRSPLSAKEANMTEEDHPIRQQEVGVHDLKLYSGADSRG